VVEPGGGPAVIGLYRPLAVVAALMHTKITQEMVGAIFGCSQPTVSRRWDLLHPVIATVLARCMPYPREILGGGTG
jgi:hypothetical protein